MSRHTRHRLNEPRRNGPPGPAANSQPVRLAVPDGPPVEALDVAAAARPAPARVAPIVDEPRESVEAAPAAATGDEPAGALGGLAFAISGGCTPAQLRRFIKSRAYLPVHEIRRRFGIESADDDVTGFALESGRIFVGLPPHEGRILGDLVRAGEVGYELQLDPEAPIIVGVYPMRPVTRQ